MKVKIQSGTMTPTPADGYYNLTEIKPLRTIPQLRLTEADLIYWESII